MSTENEASGSDSMRQLKMKRAQLKSSCTKLKNFLDTSAASNTALSELNNRRSKLEDCWVQFDDIQTRLDVFEVKENVEYASEERNMFEDNYYRLASRLDELIIAQTSKTVVSVPSISNANGVATDEPRNSQVRLPKITLPIFTGCYEEWYPFYDMFNSLIHSCPSVSVVQKFQYLKASLKGEAADVISSFEISQENYIEAWNILKARYDNKRKIIQNHVKAIYELPSVKKECAISLRYLLDGFSKNLRALRALQLPTEHWDALLLHIIAAKLDLTSNMEWETSLTTTNLPKLNDMIHFLTRRCQALEASTKKPQSVNSTIDSQNKAKNKPISAHVSTSKIYCSLCKGDHFLGKCEKFVGMSVDKRKQEVMSKRLCLNCLRATSHIAKDCKFGTCKKCGRRHNTMLHDEKSRSDQTVQVSSASDSKREDQPAAAVNHSSLRPNFADVLLSTAIVYVYDARGNTYECRALLDSASQSNFITSSLFRRLGLAKRDVDIPVGGINQSITRVQEICEIHIKSRLNNFKVDVECLVLDRITQKLPVNSLDLSKLAVPNNIKLADPNFHISSEIDLLLGAEIFWNLICLGQISVSKNQPCFQKTHLGWIVSGRLPEQSRSVRTSLCSFTLEEMNYSLSKFWRLEEIDSGCQFNPEEKFCVDHYAKTYKRNKDGRFIVTLPIKEDHFKKLGQSKNTALHRFLSLERKLARQPVLMEQYSKFIREYEELGHMKLVSANDEVSSNLPNFYLPHHAVVKETSVTTKLRVVFDGSAKSDTNMSLNDILMAGPTLQENIFSILTRFRTFQYVISADITKMYRQVLLDPSQTPLQRILWRFHADENIRTYELVTVTYGTKSASFLAIQTLRQLATLEERNFPIASKIVLRDFYVDDLLTGANTKEEALNIRRQITALLAKGGFQLRKWATNCQELLKDIEHETTEHMILSLEKDEVNSTLGIQWDPFNDTLQYTISEDRNIVQSCITKRKILSRLAKIFDPLGLLGPITFTAKCIIQQLWILKIDWDESVPSIIHSKWLKYESELPVLRSLHISRKITCQESPLRLELHGFSDASEQGYGGCIYLRSTSSDHESQAYLVCSKSRVAPLKAISIPRLELCGAVLLAKLMRMVSKSLPFTPNNISYWTDSTIVLNWIRAPSRSWTTFVANRVGEIQELTLPSAWNYIGTSENPADLVSRGSMPKDLIESTLWWKGPEWLSMDRSTWKTQLFDAEMKELPERKRLLVAMPTTANDFNIFERFSSYHKLIRVCAFIMRFINNLRKQSQSFKAQCLSGQELKNATRMLVKLVQREEFAEEMRSLSKCGELPKGSKILALRPFIDDEGLLRVGGRLENSNLPFEVKHQMILPSKHSFTRLLIEAEHKRYLHAGAQATLSAIRTHFWPLSARNTVRHVIRKCVTCFRFAPQVSQPLMGSLPASRAKHGRPFSTVGIDYCGPFLVRESKRRNSKQVKSYVSIFICFATKSVHVELVMDMTTESFLAALKRFLSRRGRPVEIISDNGTNFVGANRELRELRDLFLKDNTQRQICDFLATESINWRFIPPRAPHFGGLWESAVRSVKFHLKRVAGNALLNHDEFYTLLTQVEAILNSRPLCALSNDPNDYSFLSPGHFLIGDSLMAHPEPDLTTIKETRLSRWQRIEQLKQHLWKRWYKEYLHQQQERTKWKEGRGRALSVNDLVLIQEDNVPPLCWPRGRIEAIHPGRDGIVRTATVRTQNGTYKRPTVKLCVLPMDG